MLLAVAAGGHPLVDAVQTSGLLEALDLVLWVEALNGCGETEEGETEPQTAEDRKQGRELAQRELVARRPLVVESFRAQTVSGVRPCSRVLLIHRHKRDRKLTSKKDKDSVETKKETVNKGQCH